MISDRRFDAARRFEHRHALFIVIVSATFLMDCGCARARPTIAWWNLVPPVRWSGKAHETTGTAVVQDKPVEPSMAANVALKSDEATGTESTGTTATPVRTPSSSLRLGNRFPRTDAKLSDANGANAVSAAPDAANSETLADTETTDSSLQRLNAALSDDANQRHPLPQKSLTTLDARIRIDSLLAKAKQLFDVGQFDQARQTALAAQELSEDSQIDFFPDEDRPIDLIRRIEGQKKAMQNNSAFEANKEASEATQVSHQSESAKPPSKSEKSAHSTEKDASGLTRIRRDWSTLFRREKKVAPQDLKAVGAETKSAKPVAGQTGLERELQANHTAPVGTADAIVMANRSVSLIGPDSSTNPPRAMSEKTEALGPEPEFHRFSANSPGEVSPMLEAAEFGEGNSLMNGTSNVNTTPLEGPVIQPEFDVVEPVVPFREVNSAVEEEPRAEPIEVDDARRSDWTYLYVIFGICSVMALACYRRGAT